MNLRNNRITIKEIMKNEKAKTYLLNELTGYINPQMVYLAASMPLYQVLNIAKGHIPPQKVNKIIETLKTM